MKKFVIFFCYSLFILILGRNLSFLPSIPTLKQEVKGADTEKIKSILQKYVAGQKDAFSIYYKDLETGEAFGIDEHKIVTGASLNKLAIIAYLYHLASEKKIDLEETVVMQAEDVQDYGTGSLRYAKPGTAYTLRRLAQLSLEQSDNTAAYLLSVRLGEDNVQQYVYDLNLSSTDMSDNKTSAYDMGKLLEALFKRKITTNALTQEVLDFMKETDFEDRLPRLIHNQVTVYHKIGDATRMIHDVGIIDNGKTPFILAILTTDVEDEEEVKAKIGDIAKLIYNEYVQ